MNFLLSERSRSIALAFAFFCCCTVYVVGMVMLWFFIFPFNWPSLSTVIGLFLASGLFLFWLLPLPYFVGVLAGENEFDSGHVWYGLQAIKNFFNPSAIIMALTIILLIFMQEKWECLKGKLSGN